MIQEKIDQSPLHLHTVSISLLLSPNDVTCLAMRTPLAIFRRRISIYPDIILAASKEREWSYHTLFKNKTNWTLASRGDRQRERQRVRESSYNGRKSLAKEARGLGTELTSLLIRGSSARVSSKQLMGARKMIASTVPIAELRSQTNLTVFPGELTIIKEREPWC